MTCGWHLAGLGLLHAPADFTIRRFLANSCVRPTVQGGLPLDRYELRALFPA